MATGTVTWFSPNRGIGFIRSDDGNDLFVHAMQVEMPGFRTLQAGERVAFAGVETDDGLEAVRVTRLNADAGLANRRNTPAAAALRGTEAQEPA